jgi:LmbE family N-acetylglucosaminyl deacetylase
MRRFSSVVVAALLVSSVLLFSQTSQPRTLVGVFAHADDEGVAAPVFARYAREGVQVRMLIASDGSQGTGFAAARGEAAPPKDQELAKMRAAEAQCAAQALGAKPPILLDFPDGKFGDYIGDRTLGFRLSQRIAEELQRMRPDVIITWGPEGGPGHPDHRIISTIVTQLQRAGAPGVPERIFHMYMPAEGMRAAFPQRPAPPFLAPDIKYATTRIAFTPADLQAGARSMACHKSQFNDEVVQRVTAAQAKVWNGSVPLIPAFATPPLTDLFR